MRIMGVAMLITGHGHKIFHTTPILKILDLPLVWLHNGQLGTIASQIDHHMRPHGTVDSRINHLFHI